MISSIIIEINHPEGLETKLSLKKDSDPVKGEVKVERIEIIHQLQTKVHW